MADEDEDICGYTFDHTTEVTFEDEHEVTWICLNCGAEGWEEKE